MNDIQVRIPFGNYEVRRISHQVAIIIIYMYMCQTCDLQNELEIMRFAESLMKLR